MLIQSKRSHYLQLARKFAQAKCEPTRITHASRERIVLKSVEGPTAKSIGVCPNAVRKVKTSKAFAVAVKLLITFRRRWRINSRYTNKPINAIRLGVQIRNDLAGNAQARQPTTG